MFIGLTWYINLYEKRKHKTSIKICGRDRKRDLGVRFCLCVIHAHINQIKIQITLIRSVNS